MLSRVLSAAVLGIDAYIVKVEAHLERGLPVFATVGLPDGAVKESKERVNAAIKNSGFRFPQKRITINLAPADIKKEGSAFDLPIAVGILAAMGQVNPERLNQFVILGELALDGGLRPIRGALPIAVAVRENNIRGVILPQENAKEAAMAEGLEVYPLKSLNEAVTFLNGEEVLKPFAIDMGEVFSRSLDYRVDFSDVRGQALETTNSLQSPGFFLLIQLSLVPDLFVRPIILFRRPVS